MGCRHAGVQGTLDLEETGETGTGTGPFVWYMYINGEAYIHILIFFFRGPLTAGTLYMYAFRTQNLAILRRPEHEPLHFYRTYSADSSHLTAHRHMGRISPKQTGGKAP